MKKLIILTFIFFLFSTNSYAASEIEETAKNLLKSLSKKSLKKEEAKIFISNYALTLDDGRGDGVVTYIFDERIYKRYKDSKVLSEDDWRFSKLGALRLFLGDIKLTWKIKLKTKKTQDLILIKTKFSPSGKLYPFTYQKKEEFLDSISSIILDEKKNNQSTVKKDEEISLEKATDASAVNEEKENASSSQENNNETLKKLSEENNKNNVVAECETKIKKKWEDILELRDYSISSDEQERRRQKKIDREIDACIEINTQEVEVATIPNELVVKKNGLTYIKGNPAAFDTSPLEICDETALIWNNCKAAYEMSTAPPQIYNNLIDPKNISIYRGEFKDNLPHGSGTLQFNDGTFTYVIFDNGELRELTNYEGAKAYQVKKYMEELKKIKKNSFQPKPGYEICRSSWKQLINIRNSFAKNNPNYYRVDALVQTAFDLMLTYKGTNAKDTGNCEKLLSLGSK